MIIGIQDEILRLHSLGLLELLLKDKTTKANILWATDAYQKMGPDYERDKEIKTDLITGEHSGVIKNRARKALEQQTERTRQHAEVFTPLWICKRMNEAADEGWFPKKNPHPFDKQEPVKFLSKTRWWRYVDARRLEITCGEAPYLVSRYDVSTGESIPIENRIGLLDHKLRVVNENTADEAEWMKWTLRAFQSIYGYEFQGDNVLIARVNLLMTFEEYLQERWKRKPTYEEYRKVANVIVWNIWQMDGLTGAIPYCMTPEDEGDPLMLLTGWTDFSLPERQGQQPRCRIRNWRSLHTYEFLTLPGEGKHTMKFDFVIGNPPYQKEATGESNTATPVYNNFMDAAYGISDKTMLITPARFLFNAGYTPKEWNKKMLDDEHLKVVSYFPDSALVFPNVDIKGGVAITYHDNGKNFGAIKIFTQYEEINSILRKTTEAKSFESLTKIIVTSFAYHYTKDLYEENPFLLGRASKGHQYDVQSNAFSTFSEVFHDLKPEGDDYIRILGRDGNNRCWKYIKRKYITNVSNLDAYKAFFAKATGTGQFGEVLPEAILGNPGDGATVTFLSIGNFDTAEESRNCVQYTKTKFARAMLSVLKVTQDNTPGKWKYVPLQDFTPASDIDWSKSIPEIDQHLYVKYGLDEKEIAFIESHVKEMS